MRNGINIILTALLFFAVATCLAQEVSPEPVRVTGVVLDLEDKQALPYVNIRIKSTMYGTSSDVNGYFSIFLNAGDTLEFTSIGYQNAVFIMPFEISGDDYSLVQLMRKDAFILKEVVIFPWPTAENFERAFLDAKPKRNMTDLSFEVVRDIQKTVKDNEMNEYYYEQMQYNKLYEMHGWIPPNNFLNPLRWSNFIRDLSEGKYKEKK